MEGWFVPITSINSCVSLSRLLIKMSSIAAKLQGSWDGEYFDLIFEKLKQKGSAEEIDAKFDVCKILKKGPKDSINKCGAKYLRKSKSGTGN